MWFGVVDIGLAEMAFGCRPTAAARRSTRVLLLVEG